MKKLFTLSIIMALTLSVFAQAPQRLSYQAVIRNSSGGLVVSHAVGMKISILQGTPTGTPVYVETHTTTTNANGLATIEIGGGSVVSGTFATINWGSAAYYLKTETDPAGGTSYTLTGTSRLLSVPYALNSKISDGVADNSITSVKIDDGTITAADIKDRRRNISIPASSLTVMESTIMTVEATGIRWKSDYSQGIYIILTKPEDWNETSDITLKLYFSDAGNLGGNVAFFIRPRSYADGDVWGDATSISANSLVYVTLGADSKMYSQYFTIPYSRMTNDLWVIMIQRAGTGETFTGDVVFKAAEITYTAVQ